MTLSSPQNKDDSHTTKLFTLEKIFQGAENSRIQLDFLLDKTLNLLSEKTILALISNNREMRTLGFEQEVEMEVVVEATQIQDLPQQSSTTLPQVRCSQPLLVV